MNDEEMGDDRWSWRRWHLFHKWQYFDGKIISTFMGHDVVDRYDEYRRCRFCGEVQEFRWDSQGGGWFTLDAQRAAVFDRVRGQAQKESDK